MYLPVEIVCPLVCPPSWTASLVKAEAVAFSSDFHHLFPESHSLAPPGKVPQGIRPHPPHRTQVLAFSKMPFLTSGFTFVLLSPASSPISIIPMFFSDVHFNHVFVCCPSLPARMSAPQGQGFFFK